MSEVVRVEVPDEDVESVAAEMAKQGATVAFSRPARIRTVADLLEMDEKGWPLTILLPTPDGPVPIITQIRGTLDPLPELMQIWKRAMKSRGNKDKDIEFNLQQMTDDGVIVFRSGIVVGWDEETSGMEFTQGNFLRLWLKLPFQRAVVTKYMELVGAREQEIKKEGEDSSPGPNGSGN